VNGAPRWLAGASACFAAFGVLGWYVSSRPPGALDLAAQALRGESPPLALFFTSLGYWYAVVAVFAAVAILTMFARGHVWLIAAILGSQLVSQAVAAASKLLFHRIRPEGALGAHLPDYSYPSGHAVTSIVFYATLALFVASSRGLPRVLRCVVAAALFVCVIGVPWSRLALGAHFATDVLGGLAFGLGWVLLGAALVRGRLGAALARR
jgi:membrane-associated phospholipid phosphatase